MFATLYFISFLMYQTLYPTFHSVGFSLLFIPCSSCYVRSTSFTLRVIMLYVYSAYYFGCKQKHIGVCSEASIVPYCGSQWLCGLRRRSTAAHLLRPWVRIPTGHGCLLCGLCVVR
jgi:hypothetical protein